MQYPRVNRILTLSLLPGLLTLAGAAQAQNWEEYRAMQEEVVSAEGLLTAEVGNATNSFGSVEDLVLSSDGERLQYILYDVPYSYSIYNSNRGFLPFDSVDIGQTGKLDLRVRFQDESAPRAPEELELSQDEAENRLVSNLIDSEIQLAGGEAREVTDILVDRDSGELTHFVVDMDDETVFELDRRTIPADRVEITDEGQLTASVDTRDMEDLEQEYDQEFL